MPGKTDRRTAIKQAALLAAGAAGLAASGPACGGNSPAERMSRVPYAPGSRDNIDPASVIKIQDPPLGYQPNVIVILCDDLGYGDLGCYGGTAIPSPELDRMAAEGMRFTNFYASSPICSPSRAGLLTGRYPLRSGFTYPLPAGREMVTRKVLVDLGFMMGSLGILDLNGAENLVKGMPRSEILLPRALKLAGYRTSMVGKWHLGDFGVDPKFHPLNYGFDTFTGFCASNDEWPVAFYREREELVKDIALDQSEYNRILTDEVIRQVDAADGKPFFIYFAHKDPHQPNYPAKNFVGKTNAGPFGDTVAEVDASTGRILAHLKEKGLDEKTLVLFTSDNGPWFNGRTGGLRGRKGESYEGGFGVPFIARFPGVIPAGTTCDTPAMNIDFFPTVLGLAGLSVPGDRIIDGRDLRGLLTGQDPKPPHEALYFFHYREIEAVRSGEWKFIRAMNTKVWPVPLDKKNTFMGRMAGGYNYQPPGSTESVPSLASWPILYNLRQDRDESYNVIKRHPEQAEAMRKTLEQFEAEFYRNPRGWK